MGFERVSFRKSPTSQLSISFSPKHRLAPAFPLLEIGATQLFGAMGGAGIKSVTLRSACRTVEVKLISPSKRYGHNEYTNPNGTATRLWQFVSCLRNAMSEWWTWGFGVNAVSRSTHAGRAACKVIRYEYETSNSVS